MGNLKILFVEDSEDQQKVFSDSVNVFNDKYKDECVVSYEVAKDLPEALSKIDGSFDGVIVDLKLGNDDEGGNTVVSQLGEMLARIPVIFVTAFLDLVEEHPSIIHKHARGSETYESDIKKFKEISDTGLTRIMGGRGKIEKALSDVFLKNLLPQRDKWVTYGEADSSRTEKALLRHTLNHLLQLLDDDEDRSFPEEMYLSPPLTDNIRTGSIIKQKDGAQWFAVMNPACDLVVRSNGTFKTDRILLVEIEKENDVISPVLDGIQKADKRKNKLRTVFGNNHTDYYHWLPKTNFFAGGFLNFRKLSTITKDEFSKKFQTPEIQISLSFLKDVVARFSSYYARQGQPDIECDGLITHLTSTQDQKATE